MDANGVMLTDTITPDGIYVNANGEKTNYIPGWYHDEKGWRYIQKNGYYAGATWIQGDDGKWYYINIGTYMETDDITPDGYRVDADGVWVQHQIMHLKAGRHLELPGNIGCLMEAM